MLARKKKGIKRENAMGVLTNTDLEGVSGKLVKGLYDDNELKKIDNLLSHAKQGRADSQAIRSVIFKASVFLYSSNLIYSSKNAEYRCLFSAI